MIMVVVMAVMGLCSISLFPLSFSHLLDLEDDYIFQSGHGDV